MGPFEELNYEPKPTNEFVIEVLDHIKPHFLEKMFNITHKRSFMSRENTHVFEIEHFDKVQKLLEHKPEIVAIHQQFQHKRFKRGDADYFTDPLFHNQWHLYDPIQHNDLSVETAWKLGFLGSGILISIVDDGLNYRSADILSKFVSEASYDFGENDNDPTPFDWDVHGSECGNTATGNADNGFCGVGVAPNALVAGVRLLVGDPTDSQEAEALNYRNDIVDIYSSSWGPYDDGRRLEGPGPYTMSAFENGVRNGRNGKGTIFTWAGGNGKTSNDNCNYDGFANLRYTIAVGATGRDGKQAYYSENCAALVVVAPSSDRSNYIVTSAKVDSCTTNFGGTSAAW